MQSKMRTNGAFLRNFDSKRYQELQQQKQDILRKQQELVQVKHKGKHSDKAKGKITVSVEVHSEDDSSSYIESDSDLQEVESIKRNSLYPCKPSSKSHIDHDNSVQFETEITAQETTYEAEDNLGSLEISRSQNSLDGNSNNFGYVDNFFVEETTPVADNAKISSIEETFALSEESLVNFTIMEEAECDTEEGNTIENIEKQNNERNEKPYSYDLEKINGSDCDSITEVSYRNAHNLTKSGLKETLINGNIASKDEAGKEYDTVNGVKHKIKKPDVPERKHHKKVKVPKTEMDISTSSLEFDSEMSLESGIVYDPQRLIITEEQLSSLYVTSSSSG